MGGGLVIFERLGGGLVICRIYYKRINELID
jgi:hypothetical protein